MPSGQEEAERAALMSAWELTDGAVYARPKCGSGAHGTAMWVPAKESYSSTVPVCAYSVRATGPSAHVKGLSGLTKVH